jgi:hypothetical protein
MPKVSNNRTGTEAGPSTPPSTPELIPASPLLNGGGQSETVTAANVFDDLEKARAREETEVSYSQRQISHIVVKRPEPHWFVRLKPDWGIEVIIHEDRENSGMIYYVWPELEEEMGRFARRVLLRQGVTTTGTYFLWPLKLPSKTGETNLYNSTAMLCADRCSSEPLDQFYAIRSNKQSGGYETERATKTHPEPKWLDLSVTEILKLAFGDRVILNTDHPVLRRLREG